MQRAGKYRKNILMILVMIVIAGMLARPTMIQALFDENRAVHIDANSIENSTLIIGTHLIYLYSLSEELYEIAKESASASGQDRIYYKSELADGAWMDITDAGSVKDITEEGEIVSNEIVNALYITHHTRSDGITYDLRENKTVCIFDISNCYELETMEELETLKIHYDMMKESGDETDTAERNIQLVEEFFATNVRTGMTDGYDVQIAAVQRYYSQLAANDADMTETDVTVTAMGKMDNARKAIIYQNVDEALSVLQDKVGELPSEDYELDHNLLTAIGNCQADITTALTEAQADQLAEGTTILSQKEYELYNNLIQNALSENYAACDTSVADILTLSHISGEKTQSKETELVMLEDLIDRADAKYKQMLSVGISEEYQREKDKNSSHAVLDRIVREDANKADVARNELQFLIKARTERLDDTEAEQYLTERIKGTASFMSVVKTDEYLNAMQETIDNYKAWLSEQLAEIGRESASDGNSLYEQKEALQEQRLAALDDENLDEAKRLEAKIEKLDEQIEKEEEAAENALLDLQNRKQEIESQLTEKPSDVGLQNQLAALEADIAIAEAELSADGTAENITEMKRDASSLLNEENISSNVINSLRTSVEGLGGMLEMGSPLALSALKEIYKEMVADSYLKDISAYDSLISEIEEMVANAEILETMQNNLSEDVAISVIEEVLGGSIGIIKMPSSDGDEEGDMPSDGDEEGDTPSGGDEEGDTGQESNVEKGDTGSADIVVTVEGLGENEQLAALVALGEYTKENGAKEIENLAAGLAAGLAKDTGIAVFETHRETGETYAPADLLAKFAGYRYLWNQTKKSAILSKGRNYYTFSAFSAKVEKENKQIEWMETPTMFGGTVYIPNTYLKANFACEVYDISGTGYSVLVNDKVMEVSQELLEALSEKGGN